MAISVNGARFIAHAVKQGVAFGDLVTIGRLGLFAPKLYLNRLLVSAGKKAGYDLLRGDPGYPVSGEWADNLYMHFGAKSVRVLDGSTYEGADLVHNLNTPLPPHLGCSFDCLLDGGTLEHVFNVPEALVSYMKLVKVGGHVVLLDMPATNCSGHGFYQFSPALFWQTFSDRYGFEMVDMILSETAPFSSFWRVSDPAKLRSRVELMHDRPCHLYVVAKKIAEISEMGAMPVQDDYARSWDRSSSAESPARSKFKLKSLAQNLAARFAPMSYWRISNHLDSRRSFGQIRLGGSAKENPYTLLNDQ